MIQDGITWSTSQSTTQNNVVTGDKVGIKAAKKQLMQANLCGNGPLLVGRGKKLCLSKSY